MNEQKDQRPGTGAKDVLPDGKQQPVDAGSPGAATQPGSGTPEEEVEAHPS